MTNRFQNEIREKLGAEKLAEVLRAEAELSESGYYEEDDDLLLVDCTAPAIKRTLTSEEPEEEYTDLREEENRMLLELAEEEERAQAEKDQEAYEKFMFDAIWVW